MSSTIVNFGAVLPVSTGKELNFQPSLASPPMDRLTTILPPTQGSNFLGQAGSTIRFRLPSVNKYLDTTKGVRFGFQLAIADDAHMWLAESANSVIARLRVLTSNEQLVEDLGAYHLFSRLHSNVTIPLSHKQSVLGVSQGYQPLTGSAPFAGRRSGHYEVVLHSGILSNKCWLPMKLMNGLIVEVVFADARTALITDGATPNYTVTSAYLSYDSVEPRDEMKMQLDDAFRKSGGCLLSFKSYRMIQPNWVDANGTVVVQDKHASIASVMLCWRNNNVLTDVTQDAFQLAKPIDSIQTRIGSETIEQRPLVFSGTDVTQAFGEVMKYYHGNCVGEKLTLANFSDYLGAKTGSQPSGYGAPTGNGSFFFVRDLETSSLVSGNPNSRVAGTDLEFITTGPSSPGTFSCTAFVTYNGAVSYNIDGTVDLWQ